MTPFDCRDDITIQKSQRHTKIIPQIIFGIFGPPSSAFPNTPVNLRSTKSPIAITAHAVQITTENPKEPALTLNEPPV